MKNDIKYALIVPLIGGMGFGAEKALGKKPKYILSYSAFAANDQLLLDYWTDIPYHVINDDNTFIDGLPKVDFVSTLCPCAGLSQLNNGKNKGANATQNDWMYKTTEYVLGSMKPRVLFGENAPGLYNPTGQPVLDRLAKIGESHGYSMTIIKTSTKFHGIPANRVRSFYFFWDSETAPILNWYNKDMTSLKDYVAQVSSLNDKNEIIEREQELQQDPLFIWINKNHKDWRTYAENSKGSFMEMILESEEAEDFIKWVTTYDPDYAKKAIHAHKKVKAGKGFWDGSPFLPRETAGAFTGARMNAIHPSEDRIVTNRELMHFMSLPNDMAIPSTKDLGKIFQNVPSDTAADWTREVIKYLNNDLTFSDSKFVRQDNIKQQLIIPTNSRKLF
jgi:site-specific DNA-cytosine methylase